MEYIFIQKENEHSYSLIQRNGVNVSEDVVRDCDWPVMGWGLENIQDDFHLGTDPSRIRLIPWIPESQIGGLDFRTRPSYILHLVDWNWSRDPHQTFVNGKFPPIIKLCVDIEHGYMRYMRYMRCMTFFYLPHNSNDWIEASLICLNPGKSLD